MVHTYTVYICDLTVLFVCSNATQSSSVGMSNCQSLRDGIEIGSVHMLKVLFFSDMTGRSGYLGESPLGIT